MSKKLIIGVHGLANKPTKKVLTDWWESSIREGLEGLRGIEYPISLESFQRKDGNPNTEHPTEKGIPLCTAIAGSDGESPSSGLKTNNIPPKGGTPKEKSHYELPITDSPPDPFDEVANDVPKAQITTDHGQLTSDPIEQFDFELLYWADMMYVKPMKENSKGPFKLIETYKPSTEKLIPYKAGVLDYMRETASDKLDDFLDNVGFLDYIGNSLLAMKLKDLAMYWNEEREFRKGKTTKEVLCGTLKKCLEKHRDKDIILIAHSMGSIIAYDTLIDHPELEIDTFITIGSPLGLPRVKRKVTSELKNSPNTTLQHSNTLSRRSHPLGTKADPSLPPYPIVPENIKGEWYNFADRRDPVAIDTALREDFLDINGNKCIIDDLVYNQYTYIDENGNEQTNPHKSYGYLRCPEVAKVIAECLG